MTLHLTPFLLLTESRLISYTNAGYWCSVGGHDSRSTQPILLETISGNRIQFLTNHTLITAFIQFG